MGAKYSLPFAKSPKTVVEGDLNNISLDKCEIHVAEESPTMESLGNENLGASVETRNTIVVTTVTKTKVKNKQSAPEHHDAIQIPLEEGSLCNPGQTNIESLEQDKANSFPQIVEIDSPKKLNNEASMGSDLTFLVELKHNDSLEYMDIDLVKNNGLPEINSSDLKLITSSFQAREDDQMEKKKHLPSENDMEPTKDDDPTTSLQRLQDSPVGNAFDSCVNKVYASKKEMKKKGKWTVHEDIVHKALSTSDLQRVVPDCGVIVEANLESSSTDCQKEAKNNIDNGANKQDKLLEVFMSPERTPVNCTRRKLLVLDLNGLLVDVVNFQSNWRKPDTKVAGRSVYKRPFCNDFLKFCFERFDVGFWSSRIRKNLLAVVNFLMEDDKDKLLFLWDQSKCTDTGFKTIENRTKPLFLKELKKIWDKEEPSLPWEKGEYTPSNTLLLDDSPYKALRNPPYTAIFPRSYCFKDENDDSLGPGGDLRVYLEGLAKSDDVPRHVQEHPFGQCGITSANPSWPFYLKVAGVENSLAPLL